MKNLVWEIIRLGPVSIKASALCAGAAEFRPLHTSGCAAQGHGGLCSGSTAWVMAHGAQTIGIVFEWIQTGDGVLALADPMHILSNAVLVHDDGEFLSERGRALHLNNLVHALDWQAEPRVLAAEAARQGRGRAQRGLALSTPAPRQRLGAWSPQLTV